MLIGYAVWEKNPTGPEPDGKSVGELLPREEER